MPKVGQGAKRRGSSWLLLVLLGLGLACLALPETAAGGLATAWIRSYQGLTNGYGTTGLITLDSQGNVFVIQWGDVIIKYSADGEEMWVRSFSGSASAMAVDGQGNVYVTGGMQVKHGEYANSDYVTVKYSPDGRQLWMRRYNGPANGNDGGRALALDGQGNVYVTGGSDGGESGSGCLTIKYDTDGRFLWLHRYSNQSGSGSYGIAIAVDTQGNAFVAGGGYTVIKYSPDGRPLWVRRYRGAATALAVDGLGNVYVTGSTSESQYTSDYTTVKYSPEGRRLWVRKCRWTSPDPCKQARAIVVDSQGNILITGYSFNPNWLSAYYCATVKYSPNGQRLWMRIFEPSLPYQISDMTSESLGKVRVPDRDRAATGAFNHDSQAPWLAALDEAGGVESSSSSSSANTMALDPQDNVYLAHIGLLKYRADGRWLWLQYLNGLDSIIPLTSVAVDSQGNVYGAGGNLTVKYTQTP